VTKKKSLALTANVPVVKSKVPERQSGKPLHRAEVSAVKAKGEYHEFDDYAEAARILGERIERLENTEDGKGCWVGDLESTYAEFARGREMFERPELYRERKTRRQNLREITRRVVTEKVGLLLASFPNASPGNGEAYLGMMIEEVIAANPRASALEGACRALRRTKNFAPTICEMLKELRAQAEMFDKVLGVWEEELEWAVQERERLVAAYEARLAKEAEDKRQEEERRRQHEARVAEMAREQLEREQREREEREAEAAEEARRSEEWDRKNASADACSKMYPELWDKVLGDVAHKLAAHDETTQAGIRAADGLYFYIMELVSARLRAAANGASVC
jgi:hypothetical protein